MPPTRGLTLFVDADDTLWENNIYYEAVVADYLALAQRHGCPPERARARLIEVERERVGRFGYGISNFQASLELACRSVVEPAVPVDTGHHCRVVRIAAPPGRDPPGRSGDDAAGPGRPAPRGAPDQGRRRRPDGQGRPIRPPAPPAPGGCRAREGRERLPRRRCAGTGRIRPAPGWWGTARSRTSCRPWPRASGRCSCRTRPPGPSSWRRCRLRTRPDISCAIASATCSTVLAVRGLGAAGLRPTRLRSEVRLGAACGVARLAASVPAGRRSLTILFTGVEKLHSSPYG